MLRGVCSDRGEWAGMRIAWLSTETLVDGLAADTIEMALEWMVVIKDTRPPVENVLR